MLSLTGASTPLKLYGSGALRVRPTPVLRSRAGRSASSREPLHTFHNADDWFLFSIKEITSRLHRCCGFCGEPEFHLVRGLSTGDSQVDNQGINPRLRPQSLTVRAFVHRCPQAVPRLSTGFIPCPVQNVGTLPGRRPQNLQQEIHRRPQAVDKDVTVRVCPHRFPQGSCTSVGCGVSSYPPSGDRACGDLWISVENVGTKPTRSDVDNIPVPALNLALRKASICGLSCDDLGITCGQRGAQAVDNLCRFGIGAG